MMSVPGLALFYGGLVRTKNMLSILMQVFMIVSVAGLVWCCWGYSIAFTSGGDNHFFGGLSKAFLMGVDGTTYGATFSNNVRSEEHTSELQSLMRISYAVICLKKKKTQKTIISHTPTHIQLPTIK